jgi:hypothetical protein
VNVFSERLVLPTRRPFSWPTFRIVLAATVVGIAAVLPYALSLTAAAPRPLNQRLPHGLLLSLQMLANSVLYGVLAGVGLFLACRIGLGLPFIEGWVQKNPVRNRFLRIAVFSALIGVIGALIVSALDLWVFGPSIRAMFQGLHKSLPASTVPPAWQGFLASFEGGITEEVLLRLFAMTFFAWLGSLLSHDSEGRPGPAILWIANVLAAVVFGLGHLPATAAVGLALSPVVIMRAVVLNGLLGVAFGWLYATRGLESAVLSHFSADIVLHVILPLV